MAGLAAIVVQQAAWMFACLWLNADMAERNARPPLHEGTSVAGIAEATTGKKLLLLLEPQG